MFENYYFEIFDKVLEEQQKVEAFLKKQWDILDK
jgi:hypothetical protein